MLDKSLSVSYITSYRERFSIKMMHPKLAPMILGAVTFCQALTLQETLEYTLKHAPDIKIGQAERNIQQSELSKKMGAFFPSIDSHYEVLKDKYTQSTSLDLETILWRNTFDVIATQNVFDGLSRYNEYRSQERTVLAQTQSIKYQSLSILYEVSSAYLRLLSSQKQLEYAKENFNQLKELSDLIEKRAKEGVSKEVERVQALGRLAVARSNLLQQLGELYKDRARFKHLTGGLEPVDLQAPLFDGISYESYQDYWNSVQDYGWGLKEYAYLKDAAYYQYEATKGNFFPQVDLVARYQTRKNIDGNPALVKNYQGGLQFSMNLFRGSRDLQTTYISAQRYQQALMEHKRQHNYLQYQSEAAWQNFFVAKDSQQFFQEHVNAASATTKSYRDQFLLGQKSLMDLLDAYNELFRARNALCVNEQEMTQSQLHPLVLNADFINTVGLKSYSNIFPSPEEEKAAVRKLVRLV